jgi:mycofactocin system glycosyltransferase
MPSRAATPDPAPESRLWLDRSVRRIDQGRVLIGGSPVRLFRLSAAGAGVVERLAGGAVVGESLAARRLARRLLDGGVAHPVVEPSGAQADEVTVVIPTLGRAPGLARTLAALAAGGARPAKVVVVDDGSPGAEATAIAEVARAAGADLVRRDRNGGPAAARNSGLAVVTTALVAFVDAEVEPSPDWLAYLLPHFADPAVMAVAPRVMPSVGAADQSGARGSMSDVLDRFERSRSPLDLGPTAARVAPRTRVAYVPTTALVVRVDALTEVGGFDEALQFGEDVDLIWRLVEAGGTVRYEPAASVGHPIRPDLGAWLRQRFDYGSSAAPLSARHPAALAPVSVSIWSAAAWALAAAGFPIAGVTVGVAASAQLPARLGALDHPWTEGLRLAGGGTWAAWRPLSSAVTRTWWPLAIGAALVSRRARRAVVAAALVPALVDWWHGDRALDPVRYTALRVADDLAYGTGVWAGCWQHRTIKPLRPDLHSWPGRTTAG